MNSWASVGHKASAGIVTQLLKWLLRRLQRAVSIHLFQHQQPRTHGQARNQEIMTSISDTEQEWERIKWQEQEERPRWQWFTAEKFACRPPWAVKSCFTCANVVASSAKETLPAAGIMTSPLLPWRSLELFKFCSTHYYKRCSKDGTKQEQVYL